MATSAARTELAFETQPDLLKQHEIIESLAAGIQLSQRPELASLVNWGGAAREPLHRWFRYREAFAPGLIDALHLRPPFLDPFSGCGSIIVGAAQRGLAATGIDVNPLATFVSRVKLRPLSKRQLNQMSRFAEARSLKSVDPWPMPDLSIAAHVFEPEIADEILRLRTLIESESLDEAIHDAVLLAWLSILEPCGSYFKEGNGLKYRRRKRTANGYVLRTEGEWQRQRFGPDQRAFVRQTFANAVSTMVDDARVWGSGRWDLQAIHDGSAMQMSDLLGDAKFGSIVFSPPYANRFDYFESMKVELWFGGFVSSYEDGRALRKRSLRSHLGADLSAPARRFAELEGLIGLMDPAASSVRMGVPSALRGYFDDMAAVLSQCCSHLEPGGRCHVVVGNSAFAGVIVPTDVLLARIALDVGFSTASIDRVRHLTVAPQQRGLLAGLQDVMRESVVVLS